MMLSISYFLIAYMIFVIFWLIFTFFNIFHAVRFGLAAPANKITLTIYIIVSGVVLLSSLIFASLVDWNQSVELLSII